MNPTNPSVDGDQVARNRDKLSQRYLALGLDLMQVHQLHREAQFYGDTGKLANLEDLDRKLTEERAYLAALLNTWKAQP